MDLKDRPEWEKEIVAEFSAAALSFMVGRQLNIGNHYEYIEHYAQGNKMTVVSAAIGLLGSFEKVLKKIIQVR